MTKYILIAVAGLILVYVFFIKKNDDEIIDLKKHIDVKKLDTALSKTEVLNNPELLKYLTEWKAANDAGKNYKPETISDQLASQIFQTTGIVTAGYGRG